MMGQDKFYHNDGTTSQKRDWSKPLHRIDGPAAEYANGDKFWYQNGISHRTDGPAEEYSNGDKHWYQNGQLHRTDGPAVEYANGDKWWYQNNQLHRTDGPAIECVDGDKAWYVRGIEIKAQPMTSDRLQKILVLL